MTEKKIRFCGCKKDVREFDWKKAEAGLKLLRQNHLLNPAWRARADVSSQAPGAEKTP